MSSLAARHALGRGTAIDADDRHRPSSAVPLPCATAAPTDDPGIDNAVVAPSTDRAD
ncbi:MAG: hypothetical protein R2710_11025 [Acidimicrobiales bacterium]